MIRQYHLPLPQHEAMTAEDFMVTDSNREAVVWLGDRAPSSWTTHCLTLHGPAGSGKTHLLTVWARKHEAVTLVPGADVLDDLVNQARTFHALALDDADRIAGQAEHEEWLQHLYNATKSSGIPLLLTARTAPSGWGLGLKDIASRLKSCLAVELHEPDDDLMRGMLLKQFSDRQLLVETEVVEYLARRLERTAAAIREAVTLLDQTALEQGHKISVPFAQKVLAQQLSFDTTTQP